MKINPNNVDIIVAWGNCLLSLGKQKYAYKTYKLALEKDPNSSKALISMGDYYLINKKYEKAREYYEKVEET